MADDMWRNEVRDPANFRHWQMPRYSWRYWRWEHRGEYPAVLFNMIFFGVFFGTVIYSSGTDFVFVAPIAALAVFYLLDFLWAGNKARQYRKAKRENS